MPYTEEESRNLFLNAVDLGLSGAELLDDTAAVIRDCNGIGADWMPEKARELVTTLNPYMVTAAAIHDRRYAIGGNEEARAAADAEFYQNVCTTIKANYGWYNPLRYTHLLKAKSFYQLLRKFGGKAWTEAAA